MIVGTKMRSREPAGGGIEKERHCEPPVRRDDRTRRFDHDLKPQRAARYAQLLFEAVEHVGKCRDLFGKHDLWQCNKEIVRQAAGRLGQTGKKKVQRPDRTPVSLGRHRLDANADERRQRTARQSLCHLVGGTDGVGVLFVIGPDAVAVLKIDPKVLDRFAGKLFPDSFMHNARQFARYAEDRGQHRRVARVFVKCRRREPAELCRCLGAEKLGSAVNCVNRLAAMRVSRKTLSVARKRRTEPFGQRSDQFCVEGRLHRYI